MSITESLTVEILGDSSPLEQELSQVADSLSGLQEQLEGIAAGTGQFAAQLQNLAGALGPLQAISQQLSLLSQQIQGLSQQPVTINVSPALGALQQLTQAIQAAAQQLAALNLSAAIGGMTGGTTGMGRLPTLPGFATGGLVTGPAGIDQVPARLTAGEYVLSRNTVSSVGIATLNLLNEGREGTLPFHAPGMAISGAMRSTSSAGELRGSGTSPLTNNHFGGISIHIRETADLGELMRDLQHQGIQLRHRRG